MERLNMRERLSLMSILRAHEMEDTKMPIVDDLTLRALQVNLLKYDNATLNNDHRAQSHAEAIVVLLLRGHIEGVV